MICPCEGKEGAEILVDYCAGTLDPHRAARFDRHIQACGECRRLVEAQRDIWKTLDRWTPEAVPLDFDARLYARIAQEQAAPQWRQWWRRIFRPALPYAVWKPAVSMAAAGAVLAVGLLVHTPDRPRDSTTRMRTEKVDIEQVEQTLDDLDMLTPRS